MTAQGYPGHTVLAVPVPEFEPFVRSRWEHYDPALVSTDPSFTHAHLTALAPFLAQPREADLATVAAIVASTPAFEVTFAEIATFPSGIIHAVPEPAGHLVELTARLCEAFPQCPPYAGEFDVVPHLTLDAAGGTVTEASVRAALAGLLPVTVPVRRLELHWYATGDCHVRAGWDLGAAAV